MANTPRIITRTIIGAKLLSALQQGKPYTHVPNTTLNEYFGINPSVLPDNSETPRQRYYCIGMGGHVNRVGSDGGHYTSARKHRPTDFGLYTPLPFLLRPVGEDLDTNARRRYALRKLVTINGETFIAYYLKRVDLDDRPVEMLHNTTVDGVTTTVPFIPSQNNLFPTPADPPVNGAITTDGNTLTTTSIQVLDFSPQDAAELMNVAMIMYGNPERALVSEIGLVAASDKIVSVTDPGQASFNMNEAVSAQIITHITGLWPVAFNSQGFDLGVDVGGTEPMVGVITGT